MSSAISANASTSLAAAQSSSLLNKRTSEKAKSDSAVNNSAKSDNVTLSPLASVLKGDTLSLFNKLSSDDRTTLGQFVSSGKMSAEEMNDALSGKLKETRSQTFWKGVVDAGGGQETDSQKRIRTLSENIEKRMSDMDKFSNSASRLDHAVAITNELRGAMRERSSLMSAQDEHGVNATTRLSADFAMNKLSRSDTERSASAKLTALGFNSDTFNSVLKDTAADDVAKR